MTWKILLLIPFISLVASAVQQEEKAVSVKESVAAGIKFLIEKQNVKGQWGDDDYNWRFGHKHHAGISAIAVLALCALSDAKIDGAGKTISEAIDGAAKWITESYKVGDGEKEPVFNRENVFVLFCLLKLCKKQPSEELKNKIDEIIKAFEENQNEDGGWDYYGMGKVGKYKGESAMFLSPASVIALLVAKHAGFQVSDEVIKNGVKCVKKARQKDGIYFYKGEKNTLKETEKGSCGRNVVCELALFLYGESDKEKLQRALSNFFRNRDSLEKSRHKDKPGTGTHDKSNESIAGYYYLYGHFFAVQALHLIGKDAAINVDKTEENQKTPQECIEMINKFIVDIQRKDGSWLDSRVGFQYATSMALLILSGEQLISQSKK